MDYVVPHAGTWIEMYKPKEKETRLESFPTRERGLKYPVSSGPSPSLWSFPTRERGLK